ncbi:hypothetical protein WSM22_30400 [Cytophagales bacterium WSM2-2]|nr:hypothetical protein WSM22_30400 [Cytophagales bacterium WSM2-2]
MTSLKFISLDIVLTYGGDSICGGTEKGDCKFLKIYYDKQGRVVRATNKGEESVYTYDGSNLAREERATFNDSHEIVKRETRLFTYKNNQLVRVDLTGTNGGGYSTYEYPDSRHEVRTTHDKDGKWTLKTETSFSEFENPLFHLGLRTFPDFSTRLIPLEVKDTRSSLVTLTKTIKRTADSNGNTTGVEMSAGKEKLVMEFRYDCQKQAAPVAKVKAPADAGKKSFCRLATLVTSNGTTTFENYKDSIRIKPRNAFDHGAKYTFDDKGQVIAVTTTNRSWVTMEYDQGRLMKLTYYGRSDSGVARVVGSKHYTYTDGLLTRIELMNKAGVSESYTKIDYPEPNKETRNVFLKGKKAMRVEYEFSEVDNPLAFLSYRNEFNDNLTPKIPSQIKYYSGTDEYLRAQTATIEYQPDGKVSAIVFKLENMQSKYEIKYDCRFTIGQ